MIADEPVGKRTLMDMLGWAPVPDAAVAENIATPVRTINRQESGYHFAATNERVVQTLRRLADDIEAEGTHPISLTVTSKIAAEEFLTHTLAIEFALDTRS